MIERSSPEPGRPPGGAGAVEPVEHAPGVRGGDARTAVGERDPAPLDGQLDGACGIGSGGVELRGVLRQVAHAPFERLPPSGHRAVGVDAHFPPGASLHPLRRASRDTGQLDRLLRFVTASRQGELDQLVNEMAEFPCLSLQ